MGLFFNAMSLQNLRFGSLKFFFSLNICKLSKYNEMTLLCLTYVFEYKVVYPDISPIFGGQIV